MVCKGLCCGAALRSIWYCLFSDQLSDISGMMVMTHITSILLLREHHRKYFPSSFKGSLAKQSLWPHLVMGSSNINALCILLSSKTEKAFGKTSLALNLLRSVLYLGLFFEGLTHSSLFMAKNEPQEDGIVWAARWGLDEEFNPTSIKTSCKWRFCRALDFKSKGSSCLAPPWCHHPQELPLLRNPQPHTCIFTYIWHNIHSTPLPARNQQQNKQMETCSSGISAASLFFFWGNIIEVLNNIWSLATLSTDVLLFTCLFHYATDGESCRWFFSFRFTKLQWIVIWP